MRKSKRNQKRPGVKQRTQALAGEKSYGIAFNVGAGGDMYAPSRDFALNYPQMVRMVVGCFNQEYWPELYSQYLACWALANDKLPAAVSATDNLQAFAELEEAKNAYCAFLNQACVAEPQSCDQALEASGWLAQTTAAQTAWLAMLGQVLTGQLYQGIRDVQRVPGEVPATIEELLAAGQHVRRRMNGVDELRERRESVLRTVRHAIREARAAGLSFPEIAELVADVQFGRVPFD
jgi:hypothetical protein